MKTLIKQITLAIIAVVIFSCSDKFVNETIGISGVATSAIIISPAWENDDYQFQCGGAGNADFTIDSKPQWLIIENNSGKFSGGIATITCRANEYDKYSNTGVYIDQMLVIANGEKYAVPLYYINEGEPHVAAPANFEISYYYDNSSLTLGNTGDGILLWDIISMPEWLSLDTANLNINNLLIAQHASAQIPFVINSNTSLTNNLNGVIVLRTNDKDRPQVTINVTADLGTPRMYCYYTTIDFGKTETSKSIEFSNQDYGILTWNFSDLPAWLSCSESSGMMIGYDWKTVNFTANRLLIPEEVSAITIYLNSNDATNPKIAITVKIRN